MKRTSGTPTFRTRVKGGVRINTQDHVGWSVYPTSILVGGGVLEEPLHVVEGLLGGRRLKRREERGGWEEPADHRTRIEEQISDDGLHL